MTRRRATRYRKAVLEPRVIADGDAVARMSRRVAHELVEKAGGLAGAVLIGIRTGGYAWAQRLAALIAEIEGRPIPLGALDIALYRDDVTTRIAPEVGPTDIAFRIDGARVILIDDVLYTGRTVRAALDALLDFGRPRAVQLAVLVDRGHRELPIAADVVGLTVATAPDERVQVEFAPTDGGDRIIVKEPRRHG